MLSSESGFKFYEAYHRLGKALDDEEAEKTLYKMILDYIFDDTEPEIEDKMLKFAFESIRYDLDTTKGNRKKGYKLASGQAPKPKTDVNTIRNILAEYAEGGDADNGE